MQNFPCEIQLEASQKARRNSRFWVRRWKKKKKIAPISGHRKWRMAYSTRLFGMIAWHGTQHNLSMASRTLQHQRERPRRRSHPTCTWKCRSKEPPRRRLSSRYQDSCRLRAFTIDFKNAALYCSIVYAVCLCSFRYKKLLFLLAFCDASACSLKGNFRNEYCSIYLHLDKKSDFSRYPKYCCSD